MKIIFNIITFAEILWNALQLFGILANQAYDLISGKINPEVIFPPILKNFGLFLSQNALGLLLFDLLWAAIVLIIILPNGKLKPTEWKKLHGLMILFFLFALLPLTFFVIELSKSLGIEDRVRAYMFFVLFMSTILSPIVKERELEYIRPKLAEVLKKSPGIIESFLVSIFFQFVLLLTIVVILSLWVFSVDFITMEFSRIILFCVIGLVIYLVFSFLELAFKHYFFMEA